MSDFIYVLSDALFEDVEPGWYAGQLQEIEHVSSKKHDSIIFYFSLEEGPGAGLIATAYFPYKFYVHPKSTLAKWLRVLDAERVDGLFDLELIGSEAVMIKVEHHIGRAGVLLRVSDIATL